MPISPPAPKRCWPASLIPIAVAGARLQDKARTAYTLGEGHDAAMHVPAATLPNGELFPLVSGTGDYALQFTAEMQGELTVGNVVAGMCVVAVVELLFPSAPRRVRVHPIAAAS